MASNITGGNEFATIGTQTRSATNSPPPSGRSYSTNMSTDQNGVCVEEAKVTESTDNLNEKFVAVLDQLDALVEKYRKDAMELQEKRDFLLMSIDLIRSNELLICMSEGEREDIFAYLHRVNGRLCTVELEVRTVRDKSQEDALSKINNFIDIMITIGDPVMSRQRCQEYLNACCSTADAGNWEQERDIGPVDKRFENVLLGCTLDDQKNIKKRLQALLTYLNKQTVHH